MGNTLFTQKKSKEIIPEAIVKKAKRLFSDTYFFSGRDPNISSVSTSNENGETYIQVGLAEIGKSNLPSHFCYTCPDSGKIYFVPIKTNYVGKIHAHTLLAGPK